MTYHPPRRGHRPLPLISAITAVLLVSGCAITDPFQRPGVWRPMGANEANFELQVARAADLVQGRGTTDSDGDAAAAAVDRLRQDKAKPLLQSGISKVGASDGAK